MRTLALLHLQAEAVALSGLLQMAVVGVVTGKRHQALAALAAELVHLAKVLQALQPLEPRVKETMAVLEPNTLMVLIVLAEAEAAQGVLA